METTGTDGSILLLDIKYSPNPDPTISTSVFRKPTHINHYLDWNSSHPILAKKAVIQALTYSVKMFVPCLKSWQKKWTTSEEYSSQTANQIGSPNTQKRNQQL